MLFRSLVFHNKRNDFINLFAGFDIYYLGNESVRALSFMEMTEEEKNQEREKERNREKPKMSEKEKAKSRYTLLKETITSIVKNMKCVVKDKLSPIRIEYKKFYICLLFLNLFIRILNDEIYCK